MGETGRSSEMRQVRLLLCTLILGGVLGIAPMGSAQSPTFVKIDPTGVGNVWATGIGASSATASCSEADKEQDDKHQEADCDDDSSSTATSTSVQVVEYSTPLNTSYLWVAPTFSPILIPVPCA